MLHWWFWEVRVYGAETLKCCRLILMKCLGFSPEDLYKVDASKLESLAAENKALNEQIARLEQEREKEPVSKHASGLT